MRFLDHDWQGNMSTPRATIGEGAKTRLLILLCAIWLCLGLIGHSPWKPFESESVSIIKMILDGNNWLTPASLAVPNLPHSPLYYVVAAGFAKLLTPLLSIHDAARLSSGVWMLLTLVLVGMTGRELWGKGIGRQTSFVFIACLGLVVSAHTITPEVASLTGLASAFYALTLSKRRPYRAAVLLGAGIAICGLSTGITPALIILATCMILPLCFANWRTKSFLTVATIALTISLPILLGWAVMSDADLLSSWWNTQRNMLTEVQHPAIFTTMMWYAWPALPVALWGFWHYRRTLLTQSKFQLILVFLVVSFILIGFTTDTHEATALPLLIPLTAMAGGSIESLKRGAAAALNWFGIILFGILSSLVWVGWIAMVTGNPAKLKERMIFLSGLSDISPNILALVLAMAMSLVTLFTVFRSKHSNRASATNWAIGMTCVWTLLMTLWLPMIESSRSYEGVFTGLKNVLPDDYSCVKDRFLGEPQKDLLYYFADIKTMRFESEESRHCDLLLIQDTRRREIEPGDDWRLMWESKRNGARREKFRLFSYAGD